MVGIIDKRAIELYSEGYCSDPAHCYNRALSECGRIYTGRGVLTRERFDSMWEGLERFGEELEREKVV